MQEVEGDRVSLSSAAAETRSSGAAKTSKAKKNRLTRQSRACLHCRQRKSRCDLYGSGEPGKPPCERCIRQQHECVLVRSHRGGARRGKSAQSTGSGSLTQKPTIEAAPSQDSLSATQNLFDPSLGANEQYTWLDHDLDGSATPASDCESSTSSVDPAVNDPVAAADLQNPADALEFLASVAERDARSNSVHGIPQRPSLDTVDETLGMQAASKDACSYLPLSTGQVSREMIQALLYRYETRYHRFFPIAKAEVMQIENLDMSAAEEPHLLSAILTVASRDEKEWWHIHEECSAHMHQLTSELVYSGCGTIGAVEAMLILANWAPREVPRTLAVDPGEEGRSSWMFTGIAIRVAYLLGIDGVSFQTEDSEHSPDYNRKRLAWAACYMSDRQISVMLGKSFWSRGPGPSCGTRGDDFYGLRRGSDRLDDFAAIFQANIELTQLFSNAHDLLYADPDLSNPFSSGDQIIKHTDDLRTALKSWQNEWGVLTCSPPLKASLIISFEYLRLYINAFAFQSTLNRLRKASKNERRASKSGSSSRIKMNKTPEARFLRDSIDAAKTLLSNFNSFVDPSDAFRFMPLRYYLCVIYSTCFLYKARTIGLLGNDETSMKRMVNDAIDRLQQASACPNDLGDRFSNLIKMLWNNPSTTNVCAVNGTTNATQSTAPPPNPTSDPWADVQPLDPLLLQANTADDLSWVDLGAMTDFAFTNNDTPSDGYAAFDTFGTSPNTSAEFPLLDHSMMNDWLDLAASPQIIF